MLLISGKFNINIDSVIGKLKKLTTTVILLVKHLGMLQDSLNRIRKIFL
jgi:hypothetical protein